jgi:hypothetical protein
MKTRRLPGTAGARARQFRLRTPVVVLDKWLRIKDDFLAKIAKPAKENQQLSEIRTNFLCVLGGLCERIQKSAASSCRA